MNGSLPKALRIALLVAGMLATADSVRGDPRGDAMLANYFESETQRLQQACLKEVRTRGDWQRLQTQSRSQLMEMLGLAPQPAKTPLNPVVTGQVERDGIVVERLHFQSRPGLYVTGNLYRPRNLDQPAPVILYVCGHGRVQIDGVAYGNKVHYQHHGAWFARNGYVCLAIDTLQLGEIEGIHHGTYRYDMWWWLSRGYCPAGVEAWNCIRALDYLETRPEVDATRIGVTGRSGGGAYSWWITALDDRIRVSVPVAGITDLRDHVVNGCVEGHCDCMYLVNTFRWDYPLVAALAAPRPLLISNTDRDSIFPLGGVVRTHDRVARIYDLLEEPHHLALNISAGPHQDTQELRVNAFRWFNQHLRGNTGLISDVADARFTPQELKVFEQQPTDQRNTTAHEWFVPQASPPPVPATQETWQRLRDQWQEALLTRVFAGWPNEDVPLDGRLISAETSDDLQCEVYEFTSQPTVRLPLLIIRSTDPELEKAVVLSVPDEAEWSELRSRFGARFPHAFGQVGDQPVPRSAVEPKLKATTTVFAPPRGVGPTAWGGDTKKKTQILRRFYLLGQTLDGMRVWDVRRALQMLRQLNQPQNSKLRIEARDQMAGIALYASLYERNVGELRLRELPNSHRDGPCLLNILRFLDLPQAVTMAAERCRVHIEDDPENWQFARSTAEQLGWPSGQLRCSVLRQDGR